ncbi:hypothetical protein FOA52_000399 [Chlamydomonas sp. UWO 241]|nr:hypothetical protein FOA52_000399 [Chlamydomonas sp. UWO 241]
MLSVAFVGQLGKGVLSSVVLAGSLYNVTGLSVVIGLAAGMETLCGQAYGAGRYKVLGLVAQRALIVCLAVCIPIIALWWNIEPLLLMLHQSPIVAGGAARYLQLMSPTLVVNCCLCVLNRYLIAQRVTVPSTYCTIASAIVCPIWNWLLIFHLNLGLDGAAYAALASQGTSLVLLACYIVNRDASMLGTPQSTWPGLQLKKALQPAAVVQYLEYGGAAAAMICLEWWAFEVIIILSGTLKDRPEVAVATMGITFNICAVFYMFAMSFGTAANTRIANSLGEGRPEAASLAYHTTLGIVFGEQLIFASGTWLLRNQLAKVFTSDVEVMESVVYVMPVVCCIIMGDGMNALFGGVLRGCGRQVLGAYLNLAGWWGVVVPLGVLLGLHQGLGPLGFNYALAVGTTMQALVFVFAISRLDWGAEVERSRALLAGHHSGSNDTSQRNLPDDDLLEPLVDEDQEAAVKLSQPLL